MVESVVPCKAPGGGCDVALPRLEHHVLVKLEGDVPRWGGLDANPGVMLSPGPRGSSSGSWPRPTSPSSRSSCRTVRGWPLELATDTAPAGAHGGGAPGAGGPPSWTLGSLRVHSTPTGEQGVPPAHYIVPICKDWKEQNGPILHRATPASHSGSRN